MTRDGRFGSLLTITTLLFTALKPRKFVKRRENVYVPLVRLLLAISIGLYT
jgi:hypothetical protein